MDYGYLTLTDQHLLTNFQNILVLSPGPRWHVKVADFGIAKNTDGSTIGTRQIGSSGYMAPELYGDVSERYTSSVDIWALGAVTFCLLTGFPPFSSVQKLLDYARDYRAPSSLRLLGEMSGFCMSFVSGAMADLPERRLTIEHVLHHDWLSVGSSFALR
jgi:serine/threonine protein kinase